MGKCSLLRTSEMISEEEEDLLIYTVAREILESIILIILVAIIALAVTYSSMFNLSNSLEKYFLETKFTTDGGNAISFHDVKTASDFWRYSEVVISNGFSDKYWDNQNQKKPDGPTNKLGNQILYQNYLIGGARIRQLKVSSNSCTIHDYMVRNFRTCYGTFSKKAEDKSSFGEKNGSAYKKNIFIIHYCYNHIRSWTYNSPEDAVGISYYGIVNIYPPGGYYEILNNAADVVRNLKDKLWVTKGTRLIVYEFAVYNGNVDLLCAIKLAFEFPPTGGILPSASFTTVTLFIHSSSLGVFVLILELMYMCYIVFLVAVEFVEIRYFRLNYFGNFWNWVDLSVVILSSIVFCLKIYREVLFHVALKNESDYGNYDEVADIQIKCMYISAFLLSLFMLKLFKYLEFSPLLGQLNLTLKMCANNVAGFAIMFFVIFFAYAELGYLLFGRRIVGFCGFYASMITLFRTILGDFDYTEIQACDALYAPLYFLSYIFLVFFVLMNMFIAIVSDAYAEVKNQGFRLRFSKRDRLYTLGVYKFLKMVGLSIVIPRSKKSPNSIRLTVLEIESILQSCGYSRRDINKALKRYGFKRKHVPQFVNVNDLLKNIDRNIYAVPPIPPNLPTREAVVPSMSYKEFRHECLSELVDQTFNEVFLVTVSITSPSMYYQHEFFRKYFVASSFESVEGPEITLMDINVISNIWKLRVRKDSCNVVSYFKNDIESCYSKFSSKAEDVSNFGSGKTYTYSKEPSGSSYDGHISKYHGGGFVTDLKAANDTDENKNVLEELKNNSWIDSATRVVFLEFTTYNPNVNLFCIAKIAFECAPSGGVFSSYLFRSVNLIRYVTVSDYILLVSEVVVFAFLIFYTIITIKEIMHLGVVFFWRYWNWITLSMLLFGLLGVTYDITAYLMFQVDKNRIFLTDTYVNLEHPTHLTFTRDGLFGLFVFIVFVRWFKYLAISKTMGQLNNTLNKCGFDILLFFVLFMLIFFAFSVSGYLFFGRTVLEFSGIGIAMFTLLRAVLGDFDYDKIYNANSLLAPIFFLSFIFLVFFILLNMFLAIINDAYEDVKAEIDSASKGDHLGDHVENAFRHAICCGPKKIPENEPTPYETTINNIRHALQKCGYTDPEIDMFFARYNIDPTASVGSVNVDDILKELEAKPVNQKGGKKAVTETDFQMQQEKLLEIEKGIAHLTSRVDYLLRKLDTLENVQKRER
ncbi:hypothetical protein FQR65_LT04064 [Abscondita terminalis]|nr:hypothetical protein FQR65_LT04064 [Abscondita terminalis]